MEYREEVIDHAKHPRNKGKVAGATHQARAVNASCGDEIEVSLKVKKGKIKEVAFEGSGCALAVSAASMMLERVKWLELSEVKKEGEKTMKELEERGSPGRVKCVRLSWEGLMEALEE